MGILEEKFGRMSPENRDYAERTGQVGRMVPCRAYGRRDALRTFNAPLSFGMSSYPTVEIDLNAHLLGPERRGVRVRSMASRREFTNGRSCGRKSSRVPRRGFPQAVMMTTCTLFHSIRHEGPHAMKYFNPGRYSENSRDWLFYCFKIH